MLEFVWIALPFFKNVVHCSKVLIAVELESWATTIFWKVLFSKLSHESSPRNLWRMGLATGHRQGIWDFLFSLFQIFLSWINKELNNNNMESRSFTVITILFTALFCVSVVCLEEVLSIPTEFTLLQMRQQMKAKGNTNLFLIGIYILYFFIADLDTFLFLFSFINLVCINCQLCPLSKHIASLLES